MRGVLVIACVFVVFACSKDNQPPPPGGGGGYKWEASQLEAEKQACVVRQSYSGGGGCARSHGSGCGFSDEEYYHDEVNELYDEEYSPQADLSTGGYFDFPYDQAVRYCECMYQVLAQRWTKDEYYAQFQSIDAELDRDGTINRCVQASGGSGYNGMP